MDTPLFSSEEVCRIRSIFDDFFVSKELPKPDWSVPDFQPYCLHALAQLLTAVQDKDVTLWSSVLEGVLTGFNDDIPLSRVFIPQASGTGNVADLVICSGNWKQAEASPEEFSSFIHAEVEAGWLEEVPLKEATARWGANVAVGKCNIVFSDGAANPDSLWILQFVARIPAAAFLRDILLAHFE